ncbi:MAG TPA: hypothetical protein VMV25_12585 [Steroidobacteraceae bacterium]|nr:hypothetical protein [Steroidobacteraceae bacterium]
MMRKTAGLAVLLLGMPSAYPLRAAFGDDVPAAQAALQAVAPALSRAQQQAVGIVVRHPSVVAMPQRTPALGRVLDAAILLGDFERRNAARTAAAAAAAETARLQGLYDGDAGASLKMLQAARAQLARARAAADSASARFALRWSPLVALPDSRCRALIDAAVSGRSLLLRVDVVGRHSIGLLPRKALVDVDGIRVPGRILGLLRQAGASQSVGLLVDVDHAPAGLGAGARVPVDLLSSRQSGELLPRDALLYGDTGAFVYKQMPRAPGDESTRYQAVRVKLLRAYGDGWLVDGVAAGDDIVVHGAGALWSLQGLGNQPADDED